MNDERPDFVEVQRMIDRTVLAMQQKLWFDVKLEVRELRDELSSLSERISALGEVTVDLRRQIESLNRVLDERTGHLV